MFFLDEENIMAPLQFNFGRCGRLVAQKGLTRPYFCQCLLSLVVPVYVLDVDTHLSQKFAVQVLV